MSATASADSVAASSHDAYRLQLPAPTPVPAARTKVQDAPTQSKFEYQPLDLANIRDTLMRLEESIIFALIERAQFKLNPNIYTANALPFVADTSVLSYFLLESEKLGAHVRQYTSPSEHPFSDPALLPKPLLPELSYPVTVKPNTINHNNKLMHFYLATVLPSICDAGDDENYGSAAICDVHCLQLLSKRVHYGKFVAESKFLSDRANFEAAIRAKDVAKLTSFITKPIVEEQVLERVRQKAAAYGRPPLPSAQSSPRLPPLGLAESVSALALSQEPSASGAVAAILGTGAAAAPGAGTSGAVLSVPVASTVGAGVVSADSHAPIATGDYKIPPQVIQQLYEHIMTLNKEVQIAYLLQRLDE